MSIRFAIKNTYGKAEKEGDVYVRYTGSGEPFFRVSERDAKVIGKDGAGNPKFKFNTGLDEGQVQFYNWLNDAEKKKIVKDIKDLKPIIEDFYGGASAVEDSNAYFWKENNSVSKLTLKNEDINLFYDTKHAPHALLYLSIISGAFIDLVGPNREFAERNSMMHYLALEDAELTNMDDVEDITRSDAHAALGQLRKEGTPEALFILAWCLQYDTNGYGAYGRNTPLKDLVNYHIKYIDGKLQTKKKRDTPKTFIEYAEKWESPLTRQELYAEAYLKAGEYYNYVQSKDKKFVTTDGTALGNTMSQAIENLMKSKFNPDFEALRDRVEAKWKE